MYTNNNNRKTTMAIILRNQMILRNIELLKFGWYNDHEGANELA